MKNNHITETLTSFISEITQMEKDNKKLNEDIRELEKEKAEGYKTFNTETHILLEKDKLEEILSDLDTLADNTNDANDECQQAQSYVEEAEYGTKSCYNNARRLTSELEQLIIEEEKEETKKKVVSGDDFADYKNMMEGGE